MTDRLKPAVTGAALGFLGAVGIYFAPQEPYPGYLTLAGTLSGVTIALLITTAVTRNTSLFHNMCWGAVFGLLASATVFLAKGGWTSWDAPFVVPTGIVTGPSGPVAEPRNSQGVRRPVQFRESGHESR